MSQMNAGIILGARQPDLVNAFAQGQALRAQSNQLADQNALRNLYQTQGANIFAGDQNALNSLAQIDPAQALAIRGQHQVQGQRDQAMQMRIAEYAKTISKEQAAAEAAQLEAGITRAIGMYQAGDLNGLNQIIQGVGEQPLQSLDQFPAVAARYGDALETLKSVTEFSAGPKEPDAIRALRIRAEEAGLAEGSPEYEKFMLSGGKDKGTSRAAFDANGNPIYVEGDAEMVAGFGTKSTNDIEGRIVNSGAMLGRLTDTQKLFKPEYLQIGTRLANTWAGVKDKFGTATADEQAALAEFVRFKAEAFNNLNTTLKELSGAAVTPQEAERLNEQLPNAGTGIWDGDSPTEFQAKMEQSISSQKLAIARYNLWLAKGRGGKPWEMGGLDDVPRLINERGAEIEEQLRSQGITDAKVLQQQTEAQLRKEVGI